jgi:tRNA modification GTPase
MSEVEPDTIAAIATPNGIGGVGIVRISGPDAGALIASLLGREASDLPDRTLVRGIARDRAGARLDEVLAVVMRAPRSFTGEDVGEVHGHGGAVNMGRLLRAVIEAGARHAEPGEFTRRAFENGKLDLTRAEALADVIGASSERAWRLAQAHLAGRLGDRVAAFRARITAILAEVEACIDFPEEGEDYLEAAQLGARAGDLGRELGQLAATFAAGRALREGVTVAITGPVNAGKSSLFNALLGTSRALVDASPGTTRDYVESRAVWDGIEVTLVDTAGVRAADSDVERAGIEMGLRRAREADLEVRVQAADHEATRGQGAAEAAAEDTAAGAERVLHVMTKADLFADGACQAVAADGVEAAGEPMLLTSARTGQGIDALKQQILLRTCGGGGEGDDGEVVTSERQHTLLARGAESLQSAAQVAASQGPPEVMAVDVRDAAEALAEVVGERVGDEVLDSLFARFCIGK